MDNRIENIGKIEDKGYAPFHLLCGESKVAPSIVKGMENQRALQLHF